MKFSINIHGDPWNSNAAHSGINFCEAALRRGHRIERVFFYHSGVLVANDYATAPQELSEIRGRWQALAKDHEVELAICIAAAVRRGVIDANEARRYEKHGDNLADQFSIVGLGQMIDAIIESDRTITFGVPL